jgi:hypothetical protein
MVSTSTDSTLLSESLLMENFGRLAHRLTAMLDHTRLGSKKTVSIPENAVIPRSMHVVLTRMRQIKVVLLRNCVLREVHLKRDVMSFRETTAQPGTSSPVLGCAGSTGIPLLRPHYDPFSCGNTLTFRASLCHLSDRFGVSISGLGMRHLTVVPSSDRS